MKILIDSHILIWLCINSPRLKVEHLNTLENTDTSIYYSSISIAELSIKESQEKIKLPNNFLEALRKMSIQELSFTTQHAHYLAKLPYHHKDPFDRMLICQSIAEKIPIMSYDSIFKAYGIELIQ